MSFDTYTNEQVRPATPWRRQRKLFSADSADELLRQVIQYCADNAPWTDVTPDSAAGPILENLFDMHPGALAVLERVAGILAQTSQR
jgi:hypothetical protein